MTSLVNEYLTVSVKTKGAELCSLQKEGVEYIWQADSRFWGRHAPNLFPIVGKLIDDKYEYEGDTYAMKQHGFARDSEFIIEKQDATSVTLLLKSNEETKKVYPFDFELRVSHILKENRLATKYEVKNIGDSVLLFSIGGHPAFNCPMETNQDRSDYDIVFKDAQHEAKSKVLAKGAIGSKEKAVLKEGKVLALTNHVFDEDALIFDPNPFRQATLVHRLSGKAYLSLHFQGFPALGVWSKNRESPFVCIEPWYGIADYANHDGVLNNKRGIIEVLPDMSFDCQYAVEIY